MRRVSRYVEDLVRSRRPRRFQADDEDAAVARTAITLRAARPGGGAPREEFVTALHRRLAAELDSPGRAASNSPAPDTSQGPGPGRMPGARRAFLRAATVAGGAAAVGAGIDHVLTSRAGSGSAASGLDPHHGTWLTVTTSAELPDGTVRPFAAGAIIGFVERADGRLRAVSGICTHQGCRLALAADPARFVCPCHGASFALDGAVLSHRLPLTLAPLAHIAVREDRGEVQVYATRPGNPPPPSGAGPST